MTKDSMIPFNGDYYDENGDVHNLIDPISAGAGRPNDKMSPFNGDFYAGDGSIHNITELSGGGGGGITTLQGKVLLTSPLPTYDLSKFIPIYTAILTANMTVTTADRLQNSGVFYICPYTAQSNIVFTLDGVAYPMEAGKYLTLQCWYSGGAMWKVVRVDNQSISSAGEDTFGYFRLENMATKNTSTVYPLYLNNPDLTRQWVTIVGVMVDGQPHYGFYHVTPTPVNGSMSYKVAPVNYALSTQMLWLVSAAQDVVLPADTSNISITALMALLPQLNVYVADIITEAYFPNSEYAYGTPRIVKSGGVTATHPIFINRRDPLRNWAVLIKYSDAGTDKYAIRQVTSNPQSGSLTYAVYPGTYGFNATDVTLLSANVDTVFYDNDDVPLAQLLELVAKVQIYPVDMIDDASGAYLPLAGGTMQGDINLDGHRLLNGDIEIDSLDAVKITGNGGGTEIFDMTTADSYEIGVNVNMNFNQGGGDQRTIHGLPNPIVNGDAANKDYVDNQAAEAVQKANFKTFHNEIVAEEILEVPKLAHGLIRIKKNSIDVKACEEHTNFIEFISLDESIKAKIYGVDDKGALVDSEIHQGGNFAVDLRLGADTDKSDNKPLDVITIREFSYDNLNNFGLSEYNTYLIKNDAREYFVYNHPLLGYLCFGINLDDRVHGQQPVIETLLVDKNGVQAFPFAMRSDLPKVSEIFYNHNITHKYNGGTWYKWRMSLNTPESSVNLTDKLVRANFAAFGAQSADTALPATGIVNIGEEDRKDYRSVVGIYVGGTQANPADFYTLVINSSDLSRGYETFDIPPSFGMRYTYDTVEQNWV